MHRTLARRLAALARQAQERANATLPRPASVWVHLTWEEGRE